MGLVPGTNVGCYDPSGYFPKGNDGTYWLPSGSDGTPYDPCKGSTGVFPPVNSGIELDVRLYTKAGLRIRMPDDWIESVELEYGERGGWQHGTVAVWARWEQSPLTGSEYVDVYYWGTLVFRGWVRIPTRHVDMPEKIKLEIFGMMEILNGYTVRRCLCYPPGTNIVQAFADVCANWVTPIGRLPNIVVDPGTTASLGITLEEFCAVGLKVPQALNKLCDHAPGQLQWGCDVDPTTGLNRVYLHPRYANSTHFYEIGKQVQALVDPIDETQVVNTIYVKGGKGGPNTSQIVPVNLAPNGSFEECVAAGEKAANLLTDPSFEDGGASGGTIQGWQTIGGPSIGYANDGANDQPRTGSYLLVLDNNPSTPEGVYQDVSVTPQKFRACFYAYVKTTETWSFTASLQFLDGSKNPVGPAVTMPVTTLSGTGLPYQRFPGKSQDLVIDPTTMGLNATQWASIQYLRYTIETADPGTGYQHYGNGLHIDDAAVWPDSAQIARGWQPGPSSGAYWASLNMQYPGTSPTPRPFDGERMLLALSGQTGGSGSYAEIITTPDNQVSVQAGRIYYFTVYYQMLFSSDNANFAIGINEWGAGTLKHTQVSSQFAASGINAGTWYQVSWPVTMNSDTQAVDLFIRLYTPGKTLLLDAVGFWESTPGPNNPLYYTGDTLAAKIDVANDTPYYASLALKLSSQALASITNYGVREKDVQNDMVIDYDTLLAFATSYLNAYAVPPTPAKLTLFSPKVLPALDGRVKIGGLPATQQNNLPANGLFPSLVRVTFKESVIVEADLDNERHSLELLVREAIDGAIQ